MSPRPILLAIAAVAATALALAGCNPPPPDSGKTVLNRGNGPEIKSLDPAFIDASWENMVVGSLLMGLVTEGPDGRPVPGAATTWQVSPDGLTWTFHLRPATWSDGVAVTADDFVTAWRREMDPKTDAVYASALWPIKNARAISNGTLPPTALGVTARGPDTLEVRLEHPAPYMLQLMKLPAAYPIPSHIYQKYGIDWSKIGHFVGNGAYVIKNWVPLDHITVVKNLRFYDAKNVHIDTVNYYVTNNNEAALKRYLAKELDVLATYPSQEIDWLRRNLGDQIKSVPLLATAYTVINFRDPVLQDPRLRDVIGLVYDRRPLVYKILRLGQQPAFSFVPPGIANYPHTAQLYFAQTPYAQRLAKAQALMRQMGYGPDHRLRLKYLTSTNPDSVRIAAVMQSMYARAYIDIDIASEQHQAQIVDQQQGNFQLSSDNWKADFDDARNFLDLLLCDSQENVGKYCNRQFDALMAKANQERDAAKRGALMAKAEQIALDDYAIVPVYFGVTQDLVSPVVKGWIANPQDINRARWLRVERPAAH